MKKFTWTYDIEFNLLNNEMIRSILKLFFEEVMNNLPKNQIVCIIFKSKIDKNLYRTLAPAQKISNEDFEELVDAIINQFSIKSEWYKTIAMDKIIIDYILLNSTTTSKSINKKQEDEKILSKEPEITHKLPNNTNVLSWGGNIEFKDDHYVVYNQNGNIYIVEIHNDHQKVKLLQSEKSNKVLLEFIDYFEDNEETFKRVVNNRESYYFKNGVCKFLLKDKNSKYITTKNADSSIKDNFITMDFETKTDENNIMYVITVSIFDGKKVKSFFITDFNNSDELLEYSLNYLLQRKYNGYKIYFHNFSNFDSIFMIKILANLKNTEISRTIKRDSNIIELKLDYNLDGKRKYSLYFRDSLLILPSSLKKLGHSFNVDIVKSIFPYDFVNRNDISLNYEGDVPSIKYFNDITLLEYKTYIKQFKNKKWSLKDESIKYCEIDVKSLWFILRKFQINIYSSFDVDFNNYPTLASLAFGIYRVNFLKENTIPKISGEMYNNIVKSYTGGSVDVFKPLGNNVNRYDVNSLYPSVMAKLPSPVGNIKLFKGNPFDFIEKPFGFFKVRVEAPLAMNVPILQTRIKTSISGIRTISPVGNWEGWYFSEEIVNAMKYGYKVDIIWGYLFDKEYIFKEYVEQLYKIKQESTKDNPMYVISKLLLNSLYGRFGMSPYKENHKILKGEEAITNFYNDNSLIISDSLEISPDVELVSYITKTDEDESLENINVSIASSITAYARIQMSELKIKYSDNLYYSDTDSIDLNVKLEDKYISDNLGDFKHEETFNSVVYIAPKVYSYTTDKEEVTKIKGYKRKDVAFDNLKQLLLNKDSLELKQTKFYKNLRESHILLKEEKYTLMVTENKRKLVYKNGNIFTKPYVLDNGKLTN